MNHKFIPPSKPRNGLATSPILKKGGTHKSRRDYARATKWRDIAKELA